MIIKRATLRQNTLFYRLTNGDFLPRSLAFVFAFGIWLHLVLNLMLAGFLELLFLFVIFPCFFVLAVLFFRTQFKKHPYNIFKFILFASLPCAFFYALAQVFLLEKTEAFSYISSNIDAYKTSSIAFIDTLSQALHMLLVFKNFLLLLSDDLSIYFVVFCFDFMNFFTQALGFGLIYSFAFKGNIDFFLCLIFGLLLLFLYDEKKNEEHKYQDKIPVFMQNLDQSSLFFDENLSLLRQKNQNFYKELKNLRSLLDKNAFDMGIWWFSNDKDRLKKDLDELLR
ncbi:hypothetical protein [Campylobacter sp. MIT 97-5078]|uniref:hypothetical protein n=1 Tax=Campylobacter sp. MIT 97-5078 TaxID=1548153 RepID=UPI001160189B|nr:hypothetical protein [Campylobacter sp. MIT 97-5078]